MNNQQVNKIINFFRIHKGYHSPYSVIVDGNFLVQLIQKSLNIEEKLKNAMAGKFNVRVSKCMVEELGLLGQNFKLVLEEAKQLKMLKCTHSSQSVDQCILDHALKEQNVVVCTQDKQLRKKLRGRAIPIMYFGPDQRITMQDIERHIMANTKSMEKQKFLPNQAEAKELNQYKEQQKVIQKQLMKKEQRKIASQRGVELKFIRKNVAKGPNPLSIKKKQIKENDGKKEEKTKRIRKRKNRDRQRKQDNV